MPDQNTPPAPDEAAQKAQRVEVVLAGWNTDDPARPASEQSNVTSVRVAIQTSDQNDDKQPPLREMMESFRNSTALDSPALENRFGVDKLAKTQDGTTVVRYYFATQDAEANRLCSDDPKMSAALHSECTGFLNPAQQELVRETARAIVTESHAKIDFREVHSLKDADLTFVKASRLLEIKDGHTQGVAAAGRAHGKNFIVDVLDDDFVKQLSGKAGLTVSDSAVRLIQQNTIAHEITHTLGAKHPGQATEPNSVVITEQIDSRAYDATIMGSGRETLKRATTLGSLDQVWYQRHFGVDIPSDILQAPLPSPTTVGTSKKNER